MHVAYFDEVKAHKEEGRPYYIVGGVIVPMSSIAMIEERISGLSMDTFGSMDLVPETEFHAKHLYFGKGPFKGMKAAQRLVVIRELAKLIGMREHVKLVYAAINTDKLYSGIDPAEQAFMHFIERAENAVGRESSGILIGDLDDQEASSMISSFQKYRIRGTKSIYGRVVTRIVDSVHFCRSHHSRLIQLADAYLFKVSDGFSPRSGWFAEEYRKAFADLDLFPSSYKEWPK